MSAASYLSALLAIEDLYESVVTNPDIWGEQAFSDWAGETLVDAADLTKPALREVRRALRSAQKLGAFWSSDRSAVSDQDDWRTRVDIALGARAWRPLLELARLGLVEAPDEELFDQVKERFAAVNSDRWMEGVSFEEYRRGL